jgi:pyruvate/2-oxoglutarate dehydrogenase complex dihydrolipoamide dehydrogenase (E3) component
MVLEVRPPVAADKGTAVRTLVTRAGVRRALYAGDDRTDLDAFHGLEGLELGVRVAVGSAEGVSECDTTSPAIGSDTRIGRAQRVSAKIASETACITVDTHQRTSVPGLYAAGDVVIGLDQISHAMGEGGVAATTVRNDLCAENPMLREPTEVMEEAESGS